MPKEVQLVYTDTYWDYYPEFFPGELFDELYQEAQLLCKDYKISMAGKDYDSKRQSCVLTVDRKTQGKITDQDSDNMLYFFTYSSLPFYSWDASDKITQIRDILQEKLDMKFSYCLLHIYKDGSVPIGWHNDREASDNEVVSVSFGATRKFRLRKIQETKGWEEEFSLHSGDVIVMKKQCQKKYKHCVPVEKTVKGPRINLTFRK